MCFLTYGSFSPGFVRLGFIFYLSSVFSLILANKIKEEKKGNNERGNFQMFSIGKSETFKTLPVVLKEITLVIP